MRKETTHEISLCNMQYVFVLLCKKSYIALFRKCKENDKQLLLFAINYSCVAELLMKIKTFYMNFSNFFSIVV